MVRHKFTQQQDNRICTYVKLYHFNVSWGITRAAQDLGIKRSLVLYRYYRVLRDQKKIFSFNFGEKEIWNTKRITKDDMDVLIKHEPKFKKNVEDFDQLEFRVWW